MHCLQEVHEVNIYGEIMSVEPVIGVTYNLLLVRYTIDIVKQVFFRINKMACKCYMTAKIQIS
jgi:hypothetical protein